MKQWKRDLTAVTKQLRALAKKTEKIMRVVDKLDKAQAAKKRKTKAKAKTTKRKAVAKKRTVAKRKVTAKKRTGALTATDKVVSIIKRSRKGVDVPTLRKKTRFADKKVRNIVFRAFKQGRIKRRGKGLYVAA